VFGKLDDTGDAPPVASSSAARLGGRTTLQEREEFVEDEGATWMISSRLSGLGQGWFGEQDRQGTNSSIVCCRPWRWM
jgi:hypothetical protein